MFANIIVDISQEKLDRTFQYRVPERLEGRLKPGTVVQAPFGKGNRMVKGYVVALTDTPEYDVSKMKEVQGILTEEEDSCEARLVALAAWMCKTYGSTMIQALKTVLPIRQKVKPREQKSVRLLLNEDEAGKMLSVFQRKKQRARVRLLEALLESPSIPMELVNQKLHISSATVKSLEELGVLQRETETVYRNPVRAGNQETVRIPLNEGQQRIADGICSSWDTGKQTSLLYGITGSGKTEVYMEVIDFCIRRRQQAILLIPEIALTYQTVMRFYRRFGSRISIIHSRLSAGERYDQFLRAKRGEIDVMIGPRSALFTPFPDLGIIIIDEEHEPTYQSETTPRYHARETAIARAGLEGARVLLGSATPSLEAYSRALSGEYALYTLERRAKAQSVLPAVTIADMRGEVRQGNRTVLGELLREKIAQRLEQGQQVMLFLNRRGYSGYLSCLSCGHVFMCPHCDVSLSLHEHGRMVCHYCGHQEPRPLKCPECGSEFIGSFGVGTQQAVSMVQRQFPQARILRMDMDTTREKDGHEKILSAFANHEADILIGTQMIVKGHDFPEVTLVGILAADMSLFADDYRASERTFQLLTQAAGRAGRGSIPGEVVIQTSQPDHYCIRTAAEQDYPAFYEKEMRIRRAAGYPPARKLMAVHGACRDEAHLATAMEYLKLLAQRICRNRPDAVIGPAGETIARIQDVYRMALYIRADSTEELVAVRERLERYIGANEGYDNVNIQYAIE